MAKQLKLWNGRGYIVLNPRVEPFKTWSRENARHGGRVDPHIYIAAHSAADALRLLAEYLGRIPRGAATEIRDYWSKGCWGDPMAGITPERGIWVTRGYCSSNPPVRLI